MRIFFTLFTLLFIPSTILAVELEAERSDNRGRRGLLHGAVFSTEGGEPIPFATITLANDNKYGTVSSNDGRFRFDIPLGEHKVVISCVGFEELSQSIQMNSRRGLLMDFKLTPSSTNINEVEIEAESKSRQINKTAYNVQSISLDELKNTSTNIASILDRIGGVKVRQTGGLGSDTNITINGFSGNHVKIFIDGVLLDTSNSAFSLGNMPANFAERIDVYSGVVPIDFGTDAIGGVINIITNKDLKYRSMNLDASYSYGSFNTHSSYINFGQVFENGIMYNINLYQNYSDNNYKVDAKVYEVYQDGSGSYQFKYDSDQVVERFHDAYHNETVLATVGVANKKWADVLTLKLNYSQYYNEVQMGTEMLSAYAYGQRERYGHSFTPTLEYSKENLFTDGFDLRMSANYSTGYTRNYDPGGRLYNWLGESGESSSISVTDNEAMNNSVNANIVGKYLFLDNHEVTFATTLSTTTRQTREIDTDVMEYGLWSDPMVNLKNIAGLSYRFNIQDKFDATLFAKNYWQLNEANAYVSKDTYEWTSVSNNYWGYGAAATYFLPSFLKGTQVKLSYEKAYRLPTTTEVLGDTAFEIGTGDLLPESSNNYNFGLSYNRKVNKHMLYGDFSLIYRYTYDYIQRETSSTAYGSTATYYNFGEVETKGYTLSARYGYNNYFSFGGSYSNISGRNMERNLTVTDANSVDVTYGVRMPNNPYRYANADGELNISQILQGSAKFFKEHKISLTYDLFYQHEFPLYWENIGESSTKSYVPTQLSHSLVFNYSLKEGRYNFTFEARNITDEKLYDNYSLQKAGRAYYAKVRVNINKSRVQKEQK